MRLLFDVDSEPLNNVPNSGKASLFKQRRYCMNDLEFGWYHFIFKWYSCQLNIDIRYCTSFPFARECILKKIMPTTNMLEIKQQNANILFEK